MERRWLLLLLLVLLSLLVLLVLLLLLLLKLLSWCATGEPVPGPRSGPLIPEDGPGGKSGQAGASGWMPTTHHSTTGCRAAAAGRKKGRAGAGVWVVGGSGGKTVAGVCLWNATAGRK